LSKGKPAADAKAKAQAKGKPRKPRPPAAVLAPGPEGRKRRPAAVGSKRRRFLVDRRFQIRFVLALVGYMGLLLTVLAVLTKLHMIRLGTLVKDIPAVNQDAVTAINAFLLSYGRWFYVAFAVIAVLVAAVLVIAGVLASHRLAGPMPRLKRYLRERAFRPDAPPIGFRKKDRLVELAEAINHANEAVEKRRLEFHAMLADVAARARLVALGTNAEEALENLEAMEDIVRDLTSRLEAGSPSS
jgi:hypothetical protein